MCVVYARGRMTLKTIVTGSVRHHRRNRAERNHEDHGHETLASWVRQDDAKCGCWRQWRDWFQGILSALGVSVCVVSFNHIMPCCKLSLWHILLHLLFYIWIWIHNTEYSTRVPPSTMMRMYKHVTRDFMASHVVDVAESRGQTSSLSTLRKSMRNVRLQRRSLKEALTRKSTMRAATSSTPICKPPVVRKIMRKNRPEWVISSLCCTTYTVVLFQSVRAIKG